MSKLRKPEDFDYDVCLSFAGEDRSYVRQTASKLANLGIRVFFDEYEEIELWGKDLYVHLDEIYRNSARYCVLFISKNYARKLWTNHERQSAQARALSENEEYILPARFDDTDIPGLRDTIGYVDLRNKSPEEFANLIAKKIGNRSHHYYFPPIPDRLIDYFNVKEDEGREEIIMQSRKFFDVLQRMTQEERYVVFLIFKSGCPSELPENIHIDIDLLRRYSGFAPSKIKRLMGNLQSLGFNSKIREDTETERCLGQQKTLVVEWHDMSVGQVGPATDIATAMIGLVTEGYCEEHGYRAFERLDFGQLSSATHEKDEHPRSNS